MNEPGKSLYAKLLSRSAYIFAIRFFPAAATLAVAILFARHLPKSTVGFYQNFWVNVTVLQAFAFLGLPALILTHSAESLNKWMSALKPLHIALGALWLLCVTVVFLFLLEPNDKFSQIILGALFVTQALCLLLESIGMVQGRFRIIALNSFFYALIFSAAHLLVIKGVLQFNALFSVLLIIQIARLVSYAGLVLSGFQKNQISTEGPTHLIRKQWRDLGLYDVLQVCARWLDKLIVAQIVGPAVLSIYIYGTTDIPFVALLLGAAGTGLLQQMAFGSASKQETMKLVRYSGGVLGRLVFPVFFFFLFFREEFIVSLFSASYIKAVPLFAISICTMPLRAYSFTTLLQHYNRVGLINIGAVLDLIISIGLAYPLYRWLGLSGIVLAFVIGTYIQAAFYLFSTSKILRCSVHQLIPWREWLIMLIVFGVVEIALHEILARSFSGRLTLILGFLAICVLMLAALSPIIFSRRKHG